MNVEFFKEGLEAIMYSGQKLTPEDQLIIEHSLVVLRTENRFTCVFFWGRINGIAKDYYVAFGYMEDVLKDRKFFYSTDCYQWMLLPFVKSPKTFQATALCRDPFLGDPGVVFTVKMDPIFEAEGDRVVSRIPPEQVKLKEEERLAALVFIITEECALCPRGSMYKMIDGRVVPHEMFRGLSELQIDDMSFYQIFRLPRNELKHNLSKRPDYNYAIDFLDSAADVMPMGKCFAMNMYRNDRLVCIRSCVWTGMTFFHKLNSRKHGFAYFGDGCKNNDILFM